MDGRKQSTQTLKYLLNYSPLFFLQFFLREFQFMTSATNDNYLSKPIH